MIGSLILWIIDPLISSCCVVMVGARTMWAVYVHVAGEPGMSRSNDLPGVT